MKRVFLSLGVVLMSAAVAMAQDHKDHEGKAEVKHVVATAANTTLKPGAAQTTSMAPETMAFKMESHDFGVIPEGPAADYEFSFTNKGKEPITLQQVSASCGCTTPSYSKEPVLPGKTGTIKASYNTQGRPGPFTKTITVMSNVGIKTLSIKGEVEKAPESSVPQNSSMMKTN